MGKTTDLSEFEKGLIVGARLAGATIVETAELTGFSKAAISKVFNSWKQNPHSMSKRRNCGSKTINQDRDRRRLRRIVWQKRDSTVLQLTETFNQGSSQPISERTMRRELQRMGLRSRMPVRKPLISARNARIRLQWCRERRNWTSEDWKKVMWSDESRYTLFCSDGRRRIWREPHEAMNPSCLVRTLQGSGGSIMVWGMFCWYGSGPMLSVEGRQTAMKYLDILADQVHPAMLHFYSQGDGYFMDDNATIHRAKIVRDWLSEHQSDFQQLPWPAQSPDLNPIENVWDMLERRIRQQSPLPSNLQDLKVCVANAWYSLDVNALQKLVESMPSRIRAVIRAKGGPIKY